MKFDRLSGFESIDVIGHRLLQSVVRSRNFLADGQRFMLKDEVIEVFG